MNPDIVYCSIILVILPLFAVGSVFYSVRSRRSETFRPPSWSRNPINWWYDPLQSLFISNYVAGGLAIGSALRLSKGKETGFWLFVSYCCMAIGSLVGQFLVYRIFRARILKN